jgi:hypothetical protein
MDGAYVTYKINTMKITISYKTEEIDTDNLTEREKAIYDAGYNQAMSDKEKSGSSILLIALFIIIFLFILFLK